MHLSKRFRLTSWGTTPRQDLARLNSLSKSWPNTSTIPEVLLTRDVKIPMAVVLPAPFGPNKAKKSPWLTSKLIDFKAWTPLLYCFERS